MVSAGWAAVAVASCASGPEDDLHAFDLLAPQGSLVRLWHGTKWNNNNPYYIMTQKQRRLAPLTQSTGQTTSCFHS